MNVFINEINNDNMALFKAELIFTEIEELNFNDNIKEEIIKEIIKLLDNYDYI